MATCELFHFTVDMACWGDYLCPMITNIKILHLYDPEGAREKIMEVFSECSGNMKQTAEKLDCHYHTLLRLIKADPDLSEAVVQERGRMHYIGIQQRGFGQYQRDAFEP